MSSRFRSLENILSAPARGDQAPQPQSGDEPPSAAKPARSTSRKSPSARPPAPGRAPQPAPQPAARAEVPPAADVPNRDATAQAERAGRNTDTTRTTRTPRTDDNSGSNANNGGNANVAGGMRRVPFRIEQPLYRHLVAYATAHNLTQAEVLFEALERADEQNALADLVAAEKPAAHTGRLFTRPAKRAGQAAAAVAAQVRVNEAAVETIDQLVTATQAESRTQLIVAALRDHMVHQSG